MRLIKLFGLAALAALASMALMGVSSAMAQETVLCEENVLSCPTGKKIENAHVDSTNTDNPLLKTSFGNVECTGSHLLAHALTLASPLVLHVELFSFTGCTEQTFGTGCTVSSTSLGLLSLLKTATNLGELTSSGTNVLVECTSIGLHCIYGGSPVVHAEGDSTTHTLGLITASEAVLESTGGGFCPSTSKWSAHYKINLPDPGYISN